MFQKTVQNERVNWKGHSSAQNAMIEALAILIQKQQSINNNDESKQSDSSNEYVTEYGMDLFTYFCNHFETTSVGIQNYKELPMKLKVT